MVLIVLRSCGFIAPVLRKSLQGLLVDKVHLVHPRAQEHVVNYEQESDLTCSVSHPLTRHSTSLLAYMS